MIRKSAVRLGVGDLVRVRDNKSTLGIVLKEQFLTVEKVHPITRTESMRAVKVRWLDESMGKDSVYLESILELVQVAKAHSEQEQ